MDDVWTTGGGTLQHTLAGLTGGAQYDLQVRAVNAAGDGPWSATATGTPTSGRHLRHRKSGPQCGEQPRSGLRLRNPACGARHSGGDGCSELELGRQYSHVPVDWRHRRGHASARHPPVATRRGTHGHDTVAAWRPGEPGKAGPRSQPADRRDTDGARGSFQPGKYGPWRQPVIR